MSFTPSDPSRPGVRTVHPEALAVAIRADRRRLHAVAFRLLGSDDDADDAVQEACLRAVRALDRFRGEASLSTWLHRIVSNVCLDMLRRRRTPPGVPDDLDRDPQPDVADGVAERGDLADAMVLLSPAERRTVVLADVFGLGHAEVAALLRVAPGTVASRLHRARRTLRDALVDTGRPGPTVDAA